MAAWDDVMLETLRVAVNPSDEVVVRLIVPENPFRALAVIVELALEPAGIVGDEGLAAREKSGPTTVTNTKVEWNRVPVKPSTSTK